MRRARALFALAAWVAMLTVGLRFLHAMDAPGAVSTDGSGYVVAALRYIALAAGWYLAATTAISMAAHLLRLRIADTIAARVTTGPIQRLTRAALGAALAASALVPAAAAAQPSEAPPVMVWVEDMPEAAPAPAPPPPPRAAGAREVVIAPGDSLWSLASARLAEQLHREPSDREVWQYWLRVIDENRHRLRDAAVPDLIYPLDRVVLPPP